MFVLMCLIQMCQRRRLALRTGMDRPAALEKAEHNAIYGAAKLLLPPLAPLHEPPPRLIN